MDGFLKVNRELCRRLERFLPQARSDLFGLYDRRVAERMNSRPGQVVVDVGGGKSCSFVKHKAPSLDARIIAVDVSGEEMRDNPDVDEKRVADVTGGLPFGDGEVDMVVSKSVLEHLEDVEGFVAHSARVLKRGGYFIHLFPSKWALFAILNQMLPRRVSTPLLHSCVPESGGICGFPAFYHKCYYSGLKPLLERNGFQVAEVHVSYYQSKYFDFCFPLFVASALCEMLLQAIGSKNLCAYTLVVARRK